MTLAGTVLADAEPLLSRPVRGCIALAFTACVLAVARSHRRLVDTVKGGELSYTALAVEREQIVCSSLLRLAGAVLADAEPLLSRLVRGCIALAFALVAYSLLHAATALREGGRSMVRRHKDGERGQEQMGT